MHTWKGNMREHGSLQFWRVLQGSPTSQHVLHWSVMCFRIFLDNVSTITGSAAITATIHQGQLITGCSSGIVYHGIHPGQNRVKFGTVVDAEAMDSNSVFTQPVGWAWTADQGVHLPTCLLKDIADMGTQESRRSGNQNSLHYSSIRVIPKMFKKAPWIRWFLN